MCAVLSDWLRPNASGDEGHNYILYKVGRAVVLIDTIEGWMIDRSILFCSRGIDRSEKYRLAPMWERLILEADRSRWDQSIPGSILSGGGLQNLFEVFQKRFFAHFCRLFSPMLLHVYNFFHFLFIFCPFLVGNDLEWIESLRVINRSQKVWIHP